MDAPPYLFQANSNVSEELGILPASQYVSAANWNFSGAAAMQPAALPPTPAQMAMAQQAAAAAAAAVSPPPSPPPPPGPPPPVAPMLGSEQRFFAAVALGDLAGVQAELTWGVSVNCQDDSNLTALLIASQKGHTEVVRFLVGQAGADLTVQDPGGNTALLLAAGNGHVDVVELLIARGMEIRHKNFSQMTAFLLAAENNHFSVVEFLINQYPELINTVQTPQNYSAVMFAIKNKNFSLVTYLVGKGANINSVGNGLTPIELAVTANDYSITAFLLEKGADPRQGIPLILAISRASLEIVQLLLPLVDINKFESSGTTALLMAVHYKKADRVDLLLSHGANPNIQSFNRITPLLAACLKNSPQIVQSLLSHGADPLLTMPDGKTALHVAATQSLEIVTALLPYFPVVDITTDEGATPLMLSLILTPEESSESVGFKIASLLLSNGANINKQQMPYGRTLLHLAIEREKMRVVNFLLSPAHFQLPIPLNLNLQDSQGYTALHRAIQRQHAGLSKKLLSLGADPTILTTNNQSMLFTAIQTVDSLAEYGLTGSLLDVNTPDAALTPPLVLAASLGKATIVKELLNMGADINAKDKDSDTALLQATKRGYSAVITELLSNPRRLPDLEAKTPTGYTALHYSIMLRKIDIAQQLLVASANTEGQDVNGRTPLLLAAIFNIPLLVLELLQRGANIEHADMNGETALVQAVNKGHKDIIKLLVEKKANASHLAKNGNTPLLVALSKKDLSLLTLLLSTNPDVNVPCGDKIKLTYLTFASTMEGPFVRLFLEKGANPNQTILNPTGGESPLSIASKMNFHGTVDLLIKAGASVNLPIDPEGLTALTRLFIKRSSILMPYSRIHMVKHLIAKGADIRQKFVAGPHKGMDALAFARVQGVEPGILQVLEEKEAELKVADLRGQALGTIKAGLVANGKLVPKERKTRSRKQTKTRKAMKARKARKSRKSRKSNVRRLRRTRK